VDALTARGLPATFINSTLTPNQVADRLARAHRGEFKLLYVAPERFDLGSTAERLRDAGVSLLAIDEAHCISEWGHDFRPSYLRLGRVRERLGNPLVVALTATATPHVRSDIVRQLKLDRTRTIITGFDRKNLQYHVVSTKNDQEKDDALVQLIAEHEGLAIVYASTRRAVERITSVLEAARISSAAYHAGLDDKRRHEVQDAFMQEDVRAIVATNAFGMGIDKPNVRLVVHHSMPGTLEAYYQEAGRAGRDGKPAVCYLLHAFPDRFTHEFFIKGAYPERKLVEEVYALLKRDSASDGSVDATPADLAPRLRSKSSAREVESALRILSHVGAYRADSDKGSRVIVRLLATPQRIKRELADEALEIGLLRAMWKVSRGQIEEAAGGMIDLVGLPPGFGGRSATALLDRLQDRQFLEWRHATGGPRLTDTNASLDRYGIDWATLERRRRADLAKLDAMQQYAYTDGCRRGFVLRYFGDPAARTSCGGCDNCLDTHVSVRRRLPGRDAVGKTKARSTAGPADRQRRANVQSEVEVALDPVGSALLGKLRELRSSIARGEKVPSYVVFADRTLIEMAARRPKSLDAMSTIRGVGPVKLERYGERFLELVRNTDETEAA